MRFTSAAAGFTRRTPIAFLISWLACLGVACLGLVTSAQAASSAQADGRRMVNEEAPRDGVFDVTLRPRWEVGGDDGDLLFGSVERIIQDSSHNVYVLDGQLHHIALFGSDGELLRTLGREGAGPGEFRRPQDLFHAPGDLLGVTQVFPGKIVLLTKDGDPAGQFPLPAWGGMRVFRAMGDRSRLVVTGSVQKGDGRSPGEFIERTFLKEFDREGNETRHYHHEDNFVRYGGMQFREPEFVGFEWRWALAPDGRVAVAPDFHEYEIHIWNADGTPDVVIERPESRLVTRTRREKARRQRYYESVTQWSPGSSFEVEDTHPAIETVQFRKDGTLWIQSGRGTWRTENGVLASFDVYDPDGMFTREVRLHAPGVPGEDQVFLGGDDIYVVTQYFDTLAAEDREVDDSGEAPQPSRLIAYEIVDEVRRAGDGNSAKSESADLHSDSDLNSGSDSTGDTETDLNSASSSDADDDRLPVRSADAVKESRARETEHFSLRWVEGVSDVAVELVAEQAEVFHAEIERLLGHGLARRIPILLQGPAESPDRARRGYPHVDGFGRIHLFQYGGHDSSYLSALAHEMVHVFRFSRRHSADWFFEEGFAEYIALLIDPSLRGFPWYDTPVDIAAGQWIARDQDISMARLREHHKELNLPCKAQSYALRSAFFFHLGSTFGSKTLLQMAEQKPAGGAGEYQRAFGLPLETLAKDWRVSLLQTFRSQADAEDLGRKYREETPIQYMPACDRE